MSIYLVMYSFFTHSLNDLYFERLHYIPFCISCYIYLNCGTFLQVYSQKLHGKGNSAETALTLPGSLTPGALAVDWVGDKLYVVDILGQKIDVFEILGRFHAIVLSNNISEPQDIGLDPTKG